MIGRLTRAITRLLATLLVVIVLAGVLPIAPVLYRIMLVAEPPRRADAIVVLGAGSVDDHTPTEATAARLVHGLRLLHRGYAPLVILTAGTAGRAGVPDAVVMRRAAEELGTPPQVLVVETEAEHTATQGEAVARIARARGIRRILLVTSAEHSYRASHAFRKAGLDVVSTPAVAQRLPRRAFTLDPREIVARLETLVSLVYEGGAVALYRWRGWL